MTVDSLPTLRRKIFKSFSIMVLLYGILGFFLVITILSVDRVHGGTLLLVGLALYFIISIALALFLADGLANRLASPIKSIVEALHRRPEVGRKLKLVKPNSLELLILTTELTRLWAKVTESEQVNVREIIEQKNKLEAVLESVDDALLVVDFQGIVTHCNRCLVQLIGLSQSEIVGHKWADLPTGNENYLKLRDLLKEGMDHSGEIQLILDGGPHQFSARVRKIAGDSPRHSGLLYLLHDISEKLQRDKFRSEFVDLLSQEMKAPLQSLGAGAGQLTAQKSNCSASVGSVIDRVCEDVERIRAVTNEFIQITQDHSKMMKLKFEPVAVSELLPEWIKPFKLIARDKGVTVSLLQEGSPLIRAKLDRVKFPWVISNLLSNAIRFSPSSSTIEVLLTDRNGAVEIQVKDEGPGVSEEDQKKIFEPYFQSSWGSQDLMAAGSGIKALFGIGLTIAKEVVEAHDGRIEYYNRTPHGSEFRIVLPFISDTYS